MDSVARVVGNFLTNALRYTTGARSTGGTVTILVQHSATAAVIGVQDNGAGMTDRDLALIGSRFARLSNGGLAEGLGVGLNLCCGIARAHGGRIRIDTTRGVGTLVRIALPKSADTTLDAGWSWPDVGENYEHHTVI